MVYNPSHTGCSHQKKAVPDAAQEMAENAITCGDYQTDGCTADVVPQEVLGRPRWSLQGHCRGFSAQKSWAAVVEAQSALPLKQDGDGRS